MAKLEIHQGEQEGESFEFEPPVQFGRDDGNDVTISDPRVSRIHGRITLEDQSYYIEDLGSSNGTHVNGISTSRSQIVSGDLIQVGDTELIFQVEGEEKLDERENEADQLLDEVEVGMEGDTEEEAMDLNWLSDLGIFVLTLIIICLIGWGSYYLVSLLLS